MLPKGKINSRRECIETLGVVGNNSMSKAERKAKTSPMITHVKKQRAIHCNNSGSIKLLETFKVRRVGMSHSATEIHFRF